MSQSAETDKVPARRTGLAKFTHYFRDNPGECKPLFLLLLLIGVLIWSYWNSLVLTARAWDNPLYSHGYVIPIFALVLLWLRREPLTWATPSARWAGLFLLAGGLGMRTAATYYSVVTADLVTFVPSLAGVFLLVGGWPLARWAGPAVGFLFFMFPLPDFVKEGILLRLQHLATLASTYLLQTIGVAAHSEGNRISIGELQMGVVDACSGLRMSTNLLALAIAILLVTRRPWWDRGIVLLSAIPIALIVNIVRITATSLAHLWLGSDLVDTSGFHDVAGFLMMPLALGLLYGEIELLSRLVIEEEEGPPVAPAGAALRTALLGAGSKSPGS